LDNAIDFGKFLYQNSKNWSSDFEWQN
jgi:hypothetical protein